MECLVTILLPIVVNMYPRSDCVRRMNVRLSGVRLSTFGSSSVCCGTYIVIRGLLWTLFHRCPSRIQRSSLRPIARECGMAVVAGGACLYVCRYVGFGHRVACSSVVCCACSAVVVVGVAAGGVVTAALACALAGIVGGVNCSAALVGLLTLNHVSPLHGCPFNTLFCACLLSAWYCSTMSSLLLSGRLTIAPVVCQLFEWNWTIAPGHE